MSNNPPPTNSGATTAGGISKSTWIESKTVFAALDNDLERWS